MHSLSLNYLKSIGFSPDETTSIRVLGEFQGKQQLYFQQSPEFLESLKKVAIIESSESSNVWKASRLLNFELKILC